MLTAQGLEVQFHALSALQESAAMKLAVASTSAEVEETEDYEASKAQNPKASHHFGSSQRR